MEANFTQLVKTLNRLLARGIVESACLEKETVCMEEETARARCEGEERLACAKKETVNTERQCAEILENTDRQLKEAQLQQDKHNKRMAVLISGLQRSPVTSNSSTPSSSKSNSPPATLFFAGVKEPSPVLSPIDKDLTLLHGEERSLSGGSSSADALSQDFLPSAPAPVSLC